MEKLIIEKKIVKRSKEIRQIKDGVLLLALG